ncbi:MAG: prolyl oligopeptidase family serine peptidase [Planctomycetota bacterium]
MHHPARHQQRATVGILLAILAILLGHNSRASAAEPSAALPQVIHVSETYNNSPFDYRIESRDEKARYTIYRLTFPSPVVTPVAQNNTVPAEYYLPKGMRAEDAQRPAVVCMHILDGDFVLVRMTCSALASHGIPAIMFKLPYYEERGFPEGPRALSADPKLFTSAVAQGLEDVRRTVDLLASRPEVDPERIGITGISLGGIVAASASGIEPRFHRAMLILAGGDLKQLIHHAQETGELSQLIKRLPPDRRAEVERALDEVDPLRHADRLRDRAREGKVLMLNAAEDELIPRSCTEQLASALGLTDRVIWLEGHGHYTAMAELPQILRTVVEFFGEDLAPGLEPLPADAAPRTPLEITASLVSEISTFLVSEPGEGRCHFVDVAFSAASKEGSPIEARLRFIRGREGRFKLECDLPVVGAAALGQNGYPWMVSGGKILFKGAGDPAGGTDNPLSFASPKHVMALRMAAGAAAGVAIAPHILNQWFTVEDDTPEEGPPAIRIVLKEQGVGSLRLVLKDDARTPREVTFDVADVQGRLTFRGWQSNTVAHPSMFDPPAGIPEKEVDRTDLYRIFSAMFDFAMESIR